MIEKSDKYYFLDAPRFLDVGGISIIGRPKFFLPEIERKKVESFVSQLYSTNNWISSQYLLSENGKALDTDSLVRRAIEIKLNLMFKEGFSIAGSNPRTVEYINKRFFELGIAQSQPMDLFLKDVAHSFIRNANAFIYKKRNNDNSSGFRRIVNNVEVEPISALFEIPSETVVYKINNNKVTSWGQDFSTISGYMTTKIETEFKPSDVLHMYRSRKSGFIFGTPDLVPVLDDVRALRQIEENIQMLIYQHIYPLYHYKVGTDAAPAREIKDANSGNKTEIDVVTDEINAMPPEGLFVTSHRHQIDVLGAEGEALKAKEYLDYFFQRVLIGLGVSQVDIGIGNSSNRSTSDTISKNLIDQVKGYQREFESFINNYIINELLLEGNFKFNPLTKQNIVFLTFNEIDLDKKIKQENHLANLFNTNALTHGELRVDLGRDVLSESERRDLHVNLVEIPKIVAKGEVNMEKGAGAESAISATANPSNQHSDTFTKSKELLVLALDTEKEKDAWNIVLSGYFDSFTNLASLSKDLSEEDFLFISTITNRFKNKKPSIELLEELDKVGAKVIVDYFFIENFTK